MKYLSICSGIEAASVAFGPLGWRPLAFSEIEAFPRAVLKHHYPDTPCHGDFTALKDEPWIVDADMLCGGTPCQAFSVAGNRQSLSDDRGNLTLQFVLLADAIDKQRKQHGKDDAWILWENVPGVLSTHDNAFGAFLAGLAGNDGSIEPGPKPSTGKSSAFWRWSKDKHVPKWPSAGVVDGPTRCVAWRTLDAQYFGLAQRRKRVFVLARGGAGRWAVADALLPIIEGSGWHPAPSRGTGKVAPTIPARSLGGGGLGTDFDCDGGLIPEVVGTMKSCAQSGGFSNSADHASAGYMIPIPIQEVNVSRANLKGTGTGIGEEGDPMFTLQSAQPHGVVAFDARQIHHPANHSNPKPGDPCHPLRAVANCEPTVAYRIHGEHSTAMQGNGIARVADPAEVARCLDTCGGYSANQGGNVVMAYRWQNDADGIVPDEVASTLRANGPTTDERTTGAYVQQASMQVRRLTPVECERLQGFPDGYTNIPWRSKPESPDGPRYKALGNSWAVPCARWIGERIKAIRP